LLKKWYIKTKPNQNIYFCYLIQNLSLGESKNLIIYIDQKDCQYKNIITKYFKTSKQAVLMNSFLISIKFCQNWNKYFCKCYLNLLLSISLVGIIFKTEYETFK